MQQSVNRWQASRLELQPAHWARLGWGCGGSRGGRGTGGRGLGNWNCQKIREFPPLGGFVRETLQISYLLHPCRNLIILLQKDAWRLGWSNFLEQHLGPSQAVPNCCRTANPKYHPLKLPALGV